MKHPIIINSRGKTKDSRLYVNIMVNGKTIGRVPIEQALQGEVLT